MDNTGKSGTALGTLKAENEALRDRCEALQKTFDELRFEVRQLVRLSAQAQFRSAPSRISGTRTCGL